uniref:pseudouridylate synthase 1 homolog isoform X2 n=1 Tax=Myxine glutinosa TaxID=7769 RepID=UPI00358F322C
MQPLMLHQLLRALLSYNSLSLLQSSSPHYIRWPFTSHFLASTYFGFQSCRSYFYVCMASEFSHEAPLPPETIFSDVGDEENKNKRRYATNNADEDDDGQREKEKRMKWDETDKFEKHRDVEKEQQAKVEGTMGNKELIEDGENNFGKETKTALHAEEKKECMEVQESAADKFTRIPKRKVAIYMVYCGKGFYGMQRNPGTSFPTIEQSLLNAMEEAGVVPPSHAQEPKKMSFQRCARTDKGVSAVGQVVSCKLSMMNNMQEKINDKLPQNIRILGMRRVSRGFNSKNACDARTYLYYMPTYCLTPRTFVGDTDIEKAKAYRLLPARLSLVNEILTHFVGTHSFHNFTSGLNAGEARARRYLFSASCRNPHMHLDLEFTEIRIKGQSFLLHQVRKMVGMLVAVCRGWIGLEGISSAFTRSNFHVPKAPALGLLLEQVHFDHYNKRLEQLGLVGGTVKADADAASGWPERGLVFWPEIKEERDQFAENCVFGAIAREEAEQREIWNWLIGLEKHTFEEEGDSSWAVVFRHLHSDREEEELRTESCSFPRDDDENNHRWKSELCTEAWVSRPHPARQSVWFPPRPQTIFDDS